MSFLIGPTRIPISRSFQFGCSNFGYIITSFVALLFASTCRILCSFLTKVGSCIYSFKCKLCTLHAIIKFIFYDQIGTQLTFMVELKL